MIILGIETSCDETGVALVENGTTVLASTTLSSLRKHVPTGGIIPEVAAREQLHAITPALHKTLDDVSMTADDIDAMAVTYGPGLIGSLLVGVETAKTLATLWGKPLIPVNHLFGHVYANWIGKQGDELPEFPALALIVSGGHTDIIFMRSHFDYEWIAGTRDDAAGEAFDKTARLLGLPYPGGPQIGRLADEYRDNHPDELLDLFPRPMIDHESLDMSFSGLKTAVNNYLKDHDGVDTTYAAANIEEAIVDVLVHKVWKAVDIFSPKSLLLGGGVVANSRLREKLSSTYPQNSTVEMFIPQPRYCTDNGAVIAAAAFYQNPEMPVVDVAANPQLHFPANDMRSA